MPAKTTLSMAAAAKLLGVTPDFLMSVTLGGARRPDQQGGDVIEIDYAMDGNEVVFTAAGVERFLAQCPVKEMVSSVKVIERLGVQRPQLSGLRFTGVATAAGVAKLPVWQIGGGDYVVQSELEAFAVHHKAAVERKAAREHAKKYANRGRKPAVQDA